MHHGKIVATMLLFAVFAGVACSQGQGRADDARTLYLLAVDGEESPDVVRKLGTLPPQEATHWLASVAAMDSASLVNREAAVAELQRIGTVDAADAIARLFAPHNPLGLRQAAARSIAITQCSERCVDSILFFLFRRSYEGPSLRETHWIVESARTTMAQGEQRFASDLDAILSRNRGLTLASLATAYGLGTPEPSRFALQIVERLKLTDACDLLFRSEELQAQFKRFGVADPTATRATISRVGCQAQTAR